MIEAPKSDLDLAKATICEDVADLYSDGTRELGARFLGGYFQGAVITPLEVLHSFSDQNKLSDAGTTLTQAIQKIASLQVRGIGIPVSQRINTLFEMTDQLRKDTRARLEENPPESITPETVKQIVARREGESDEAWSFRVCADIAQTLAEIADWPEKFKRIIALAEPVMDAEGFEFFDAWISDALRFPKAYAAALGQEATLGEEIQRLLALCDGDLNPDAAPSDPELAANLYHFLWKSEMPKTRATLLAHAVKLFQGNDRLLRTAVGEELDLLIIITDQFTRDGELIGGKDNFDAAEKRFARLLSNETIDLVLDPFPTFGEKMLRAIELHQHIIGDKPRLFIEGYVSDLMKDPRLDQRFDDNNEHQLSAVSILGKLNHAMLQSDFAERTQERIAGEFERLQTDMIEATSPFDMFCMAKGTTAEKLIAIMDMISDHCFTKGTNENLARQTAQTLMKQQDFLPSFLVGVSEKGAKAKKLRNLEKRLIETGLA